MSDFVTAVTVGALRVSQLQARWGAACDGVTAVTPVSRTHAHTPTRAHACGCEYGCHRCHYCLYITESGI